MAGYDPMRGRGEISSSDEEDDTDEDEEDLESEPDEMDAIRVSNYNQWPYFLLTK